METTKIILAITALSFLSACGSTNPPTQKLTETQMVINQAEQIGAGDYAPLEIREARRKLDEARRAYDKKDYKEAAMLAEEARVDGELAQMKTLSGKSQKAVHELRESIRMLKEEIQQKENRN
jgi:predicted S18 family serine protease